MSHSLPAHATRHSFGTQYMDAPVGYNEPVPPYKCALCGEISTERNNCFIGKKHYCGILCYQRAKKKLWEEQKQKEENERIERELERIRRENEKFDDKSVNCLSHLKYKGYTYSFCIYSIHNDDEEPKLEYKSNKYFETVSTAKKIFDSLNVIEPQEVGLEVWIEVEIRNFDGTLNRGLTNNWNYTHEYYKKSRGEE